MYINRLEDRLRELRESIVIVELTDCKVDEVASYTVNVDVHEYVEELELVLINVPALHGLLV